MRAALRRPGTWIRLSAAIVVAMLALGARLWAVERLPVDFDEDDYLRAGQQYATGIRQGDWGVLLRENYRPEHPPLNKIVYGLALAPLPAAAEIPDRPTDARPAADLPEPQLTVARTTGAVLGMLEAFFLALLSPFAGLFLAVHTWTVKYQSQVMLEAVASACSLLAALLYVRAGRPGVRRRAWLAGAAAFAGLAIAGKYQYGIVAVAIALHWLWEARPLGRWRSGRAVAGWVAPVLGWGVLVGLAFLAGDPYLWPDPVGRLVASITFHGGYATSEAVAQTGWPAWQPIVWLFGSVPFHEPGTFVVAADLLVTAFAIVGLRRLWQRQRVFALWLLLSLAFLLAWPTKWPQYIVMISAPLALAAGFGIAAAVLEPGRAAIRGLRARWAARGAAGRVGGTRRSSLRELAGATPWILPGAFAVVALALAPLIFELLMSLTDFSARSIKDGLTGGIAREAWLGLTGQAAAVAPSFDSAANRVQYVGFDLLGYAQSGVWLGGNSSAAAIAFSFLWMVLAVALQLLLGLGIALVLARPGVRFAGAWRTLFILPWAIPEFVGAIAWLKLVEPERGWLALLAGQTIPWPESANWTLVVLLVAATWIGWPLMMLVATAGLRTIPRSVTEAAALDGAGPWTTFRTVTWPLLLPLMGPALVIKAIAAFNQFYLFYVLPTGVNFPSDVTLATFSFFLFDPTRGAGVFAFSAAVNVLTVVALAILVAWFVRWRGRVERVAFA
ncbi:MAG: sugar ABC transporter permease [Chloroflexi bacterium]|nr:sugar ABC transporter permease [Chloroflexota bacterium]